MNSELKISLRKPRTFTILCGWCDVVIYQADKNAEISHGICPDCMKKFFEHMALSPATREMAQ